MKKVMLMLLLVIPLIFTGCWEVSNGEKIGQITSIAQQGLFVKTWEAQIVRGGMNNGSGVTGQVSHFTVENNNELVEQLTNAMYDGKEVKVKFHQEFATFARSESENIFAESMEVIESKGLKVQSNNLTELNITDKVSKVTNEELLELIKLQNKILQKL